MELCFADDNGFFLSQRWQCATPSLAPKGDGRATRLAVHSTVLNVKGCFVHE